MTPDELHSSFDAHVALLPGSAKVRAARESALAEFMGQGFPSRRTESWRYTNVAPIVDGEFDLFPVDPCRDTQTIETQLRRAGIGDDAAVLLFIDGKLVADRTSRWRDNADIELLTLAESLEQHGAAASATRLRDYPMAALNIAFARDGAHLRVANGAAPAAPLHIILANEDATRHAVQPQLVIELAARASATVVLHLLSEGGTANWVNLLTHVSLSDGASLEIQRIQRYGSATLHTELLSASIGRDASLKSTSLDIGGQLVRNDVHVRMADSGSRCDLAGLVAASEGQHIDNRIAVDHVASRSESTQCYRSIVGDRGRAVFNGKVVVHKDTVGIAAMQSSDNLLLDDTGEIDTKPELEIYADDVKCSHGATVGEIDESELFYLRARGIDEPTARGLLTLGFAERTLERIPSFGARTAIAEKFGLALPEETPWSSPT